MRVLQILMALIALGAPARAMVGGAPPAEPTLGGSVVTLIGSRGNFCSGAVIAPNLVLTAAHCVPAGADYKIVLYGAAQPQLIDVRRVLVHPGFNQNSIAQHRAGADVALLQLASPLSKPPAPLGVPLEPIAAGQSYVVAGSGVSVPGDGRSGGVVRGATLISTSKPGRLQIRLVDPATANARAGLGACTGDSGAPVFQSQPGGAVIVGVVSWSTAAGNAAGCGGLTGVTPLTLYRDWILTTARSLGAAL